MGEVPHHGDRHPEEAPQRPGPSRGVPGLLPAPDLYPQGDGGHHRPGVPHRRHRLHRLQEDPDRRGRGDPRAGPGAAPGDRRAGERETERHPGVRGQEGPDRGGADHGKGPGGDEDLRGGVDI